MSALERMPNIMAVCYNVLITLNDVSTVPSLWQRVRHVNTRSPLREFGVIISGNRSPVCSQSAVGERSLP